MKSGSQCRIESIVKPHFYEERGSLDYKCEVEESNEHNRKKIRYIAKESGKQISATIYTNAVVYLEFLY